MADANAGVTVRNGTTREWFVPAAARRISAPLPVGRRAQNKPRITLKTCKPGHRLGITDTESGAKWKRFLLSEDQRRKRPLSIVPGSDNGAIITVQQLKSKTFSTKERHFKESCPHKCHLLISWSISCVFATHAAVTLTCFSLPTFAAVSFSNCFNPLPSQSHLSKLHLI